MAETDFPAAEAGAAIIVDVTRAVDRTHKRRGKLLIEHPLSGIP
jgi:hypothetical protein